MNGKQLFELTEQNAITTEKIIEMCQANAKRGMCFALIFEGHISISVISDLAKLGISVRKNTGQFGEPVYLISWEQ